MSRDELLQALKENREEKGMEGLNTLYHSESRKPVEDCPGMSSCDHNMNMPFFVLSNPGAALEPDEFMNTKKSHEVQSMSEVVACLAQRCGVKQVT